VQLTTSANCLHGGGELLLLPQLAIDIASTSRISAAAWRDFMAVL